MVRIGLTSVTASKGGKDPTDDYITQDERKEAGKWVREYYEKSFKMITSI